MYNTSFIKKFLLAVIAVLLYSCDKDYNAIGEDLISDNHFDLVPESYDVVAFNQEVTPVQSNGMPAYSLGIFDNGFFGTTTANFGSQLSLGDYSATIGENPVIESAVLYVPYFSHVTAADPKGGSVYALDSIYGVKEGKLKLKVYESGVQMYSTYFEGGSQKAQLYYTDQNSFFNDNKRVYESVKHLNDTADVKQNDAFYFSSAQIKDSTVVDATASPKTYNVTYTKPGMRLNLNKKFFQDKILNAPASKLTSETAFQEYFRGLYFQVEKADGVASNMALLNIANSTDAKITITYRAKTAITTDADATTERKTFVIYLNANKANFLQDAKTPAYADGINSANVNKTTGDDRLYLKGGQGSLAVIDLFSSADSYSYDDNGVKQNTPNGVSDQLDDVRNNVKTKHWLVNEANLVFYVDGAKMGATQQPKRVYLYDLTNNTAIADYADGTPTSSNDPKATRTVFGGILNVDAAKGNSYKVRLTKHIRNLLKDETGTIKNVKLGLSVTEGIDVFTSNKLKLKNDVISEAPTGSVMGPLGTILYGGTANVPADKKLKLEIYYTKPN